jgi:anti-sigma factor RsiW
MRCFRARRWICAYLDNELAPRRRAALDAHLARCERCRAELASFREHWEALAEMGPMPAIPLELWPQVIATLERSEGLPWFRLHRLQLLRVACVIACVVLGFTGGVLLSWRRPPADTARGEVSVSERMLVAEAFDTAAFGLAERKEGLLRCVPK